MAMTERSRSVLFRGLSDAIDDEEAVGEMLAHFPAREIDEPATKGNLEATEERLRAEIAGVRTEIAVLRAGLTGEIAEGRTEVANLRTEIVASEKRTMQFVHAEIRSAMQWMMTLMVSLFGVLIAALALFR